MKSSITFEYDSNKDLVRQLRAALLEHEEWITPKAFRYCLGIESGTLSNRLKRWQKSFGGELIAQRGPTGRVMMLQITPELRAYMKSLAPQTPKKCE